MKTARTAAELIWSHWQSGTVIEALPTACRPSSLEAGYAAQRELAGVGEVRAVGWKIAATSEAGQAHIAVPGPIAGRLFEPRVHRSPAVVAMGANRMAVAEAEFAFVFARDLPVREVSYEVGEVLAALASVHPAIELPDSRYADFTLVGSAQLAADNACANEFVLGPPVAGDDWRSLDLSTHPVCLRRNGKVAAQGTGADCLGDPRAALTWLVNSPAVVPQGIRAGDIVTTGVCGAPTPIEAGDEVEVDLGVLGRATVTLAA